MWISIPRPVRISLDIRSPTEPLLIMIHAASFLFFFLIKSVRSQNSKSDGPDNSKVLDSKEKFADPEDQARLNGRPRKYSKQESRGITKSRQSMTSMHRYIGKRLSYHYERKNRFLRVPGPTSEMNAPTADKYR